MMSVLRPILALGVLIGTGDAPRADVVKCPDLNVMVELQLNGDFELVCRGARKAIRFLAGLGVPQKARFNVEIVSVLPAGHPEAIGCFSPADSTAYVIGRDICSGDGETLSAFGVPFEARVYESYVAHEVAHAVAAQNFEMTTPSQASHEYVAAVVQLAVMEPVLKDEILELMPGRGYDTDFEINLFAYQIDPGLFAVQSYRHFLRPGNGVRYIAKLMSGEIRLSDYVSY